MCSMLVLFFRNKREIIRLCCYIFILILFVIETFIKVLNSKDLPPDLQNGIDLLAKATQQEPHLI